MGSTRRAPFEDAAMSPRWIWSALGFAVAIACGGEDASDVPADSYANEPAAIAACLRHCDRLAATVPNHPGIERCKPNCTTSITPDACKSDPELAKAYDRCASICNDSD